MNNSANIPYYSEISEQIQDHNNVMYYDNGNNYSCPSSYNGPDFSESFHTFTLIWTPHILEWYVDNQLMRRSALFYDMMGQIVDWNGLKKTGEYTIN